jgi:hypothetical protein
MALDFDTYLIASSPVELQLPARFFRRRRSNENTDLGATAAAAVPHADQTDEVQRQFADISVRDPRKDCYDCVDLDDDDCRPSGDEFGLTKCQDR